MPGSSLAFFPLLQAGSAPSTLTSGSLRALALLFTRYFLMQT